MVHEMKKIIIYINAGNIWKKHEFTTFIKKIIIMQVIAHPLAPSPKIPTTVTRKMIQESLDKNFLSIRSSHCERRMQ